MPKARRCPVLALHCSLAHAGGLERGLAGQFADRRRQLIAPDQAGHGRQAALERPEPTCIGQTYGGGGSNWRRISLT